MVTLHDVFLLQRDLRVRISIGVAPNALLKMTSILDMAARPSLIDKESLPQVCKISMKSIKSLQMQTANWKLEKKESIEPSLICMGFLSVSA